MSERESGRPAMAGRKELRKDARGVVIQILRGYHVWKGSRYLRITKQRHVGNIRNANIS